MDNKQWFRQAEYGMMIHWGVYSMLAGQWRGQHMGDFIGEWAQAYFRIPNKEYARLARAFNPVGFNAEDWVRIAQESGMKYLVFTSKHADGFAMFDSEVSDYSITKWSSFGRDVTTELAEACYKFGMKFGLYYSQSIDWSHMHGGGYDADCKNGILPWCNDWDFPQASLKNYSICFEEKIKPQVKEILTKYGDLLLIWFDTPYSLSKEHSSELYEMVKEYQPNCLVNSRIGHGVCDYTSFGDNELPDNCNQEQLYETPATLNDTWGYKVYDTNWKTASEVARLRRYINGKGANYLLNVGPDHLGRIPVHAADILRQAAKI